MRSRAWMKRGSPVSLFSAALAAAFSLACPPASADPRDPTQRDPTQREEQEEIAVGTRLVALDSVTVSQAEISKGSTVSVTRLVHRQGRLSGVDVELKDGHIARVPIAKVRAAFRVIDE